MHNVHFKRLDEIIREYATQVGDGYMHGYGEYLVFAIEAIREMGTEMKTRGDRFMSLPVENGIARIPDGILRINKVGVEVDGHILHLHEDHQMVLRPDQCGSYTDGDQSRNPDVIAYYGIDRHIPMPYHIRANSSWGMPWIASPPVKSPQGYYKVWPELGVIQFTDNFAFEEVLLEVGVEPFTPNTVNTVINDAGPFIKAFIDYRMIKADNRGNRGVSSTQMDAQKIMHNEKMKLRRILAAMPSHEMNTLFASQGRYGL